MKKVLSLFDGMSCAQIALKELGLPCKYYASEIDKAAIKVALGNFPETIQVGDVTKFDRGHVHAREDFFLLIGGSPCQDLSVIKENRKGLAGEKSKLFYEFVRILKETLPTYYLLENVSSMSEENKKTMLEVLKNVYPESYMLEIDSALVSAQSRKRVYFTNILGVTMPTDKKIFLKDIIHYEGLDFMGLPFAWSKSRREKSGRVWYDERFRIDGKANSLIASRANTDTLNGVLTLPLKGKLFQAAKQFDKRDLFPNKYSPFFRPLSIKEEKRLQTIPDWFKMLPHASEAQCRKMLGNGFTVEIIRHILSFMST